MKFIKMLSVVILSLLSLSLAAQEVKYKIIENTPQSPKFVAGVTIGDLVLHTGENETGSGGPGVFAVFRPTNRVKLGGQLSSGLYGLMIEGAPENATGIRKIGGMFIDINGEFAWMRKGVNTIGKETRFHLPTSLVNTTKYIYFPYNTMIERTIRGGFYTHTYPFSTTTGGYVGIGKYYTTFAKLEIDGETKTDGARMGWTLDYVFAAPNYVDEMRMGDPTGLRFGLEVESYGRFNTLTRFEFGGMPGVEGMFIRATVNIALVKSGSQRYTGDYKERKQTDSKIVNFFRLL